MNPPRQPRPATSGRFCRPRNCELIHGICLTRCFVASYLANAKMTRENRPEVRFRSQNEGKNLRNRPEVDQGRQLRPGRSRHNACELAASGSRQTGRGRCNHPEADRQRRPRAHPLSPCSPGAPFAFCTNPLDVKSGGFVVFHVVVQRHYALFVAHARLVYERLQ